MECSPDDGCSSRGEHCSSHGEHCSSRTLLALRVRMADSEPDAVPKAGSLYWDYLCSMPVGARMSCDLSADSDGDAEVDFMVSKLDTDRWRASFQGPRSGDLTTRELFEHILEFMDGEDEITVCRGKDPRKRGVQCKKEEHDADEADVDRPRIVE